MTSCRADRIELRDIRAVGVHGVLAEEQQRPQPFSVDLDMEVDLRRAAGSDDVADTVDYGAVVLAVGDEVAGPPAALLERLAQRIADRVLQLGQGRVESVTVTVRKLRPPVPLDVASTGVRITRP